MRREYHKWYSPRLNKEMELLEYGHSGMPMIVFPTTKGKYYQYEDMGMIGAVHDRFESGMIHAFCVDSVDAESWYNRSIHPRDRVQRHNTYEQYIIHEVIPFIRSRNASHQLAVTGCSFGGYHSVNFALKHPDLATHCISMGGAYDMHSFTNGYYDESCYFNNPLDFLPNMNDGWYWDRYQRMTMVLATGEHDICLGDNLKLASIMRDKSIPHWLDVWGNGTGHDWQWWRAMAQKYF